MTAASYIVRLRGWYCRHETFGTNVVLCIRWYFRAPYIVDISSGFSESAARFQLVGLNLTKIATSGNKNLIIFQISLKYLVKRSKFSFKKQC